MKQRTVHILTVMVDNEFGVITRITAQIRREGWSIKSLAVSESTDDSAVSRITLALICFDTTLPMVVHRISRLACVRSVTAYDAQDYVCEEMTLIHAYEFDAAALLQVTQEFEARTVSRQEGNIVLQYVGQPEQVDAFIERVQAVAKTSVARTGAITMEKNVME